LCLSVSVLALAFLLPSTDAQSKIQNPKSKIESSRRTRKTAAPAEQNEMASPVLSPLVRVCLLRYAGVSQITVSALPGAHLLGAKGQEAAAGIGPWTFTATEKGVQVRDVNGKGLGALDGGEFWRVQTEDTTAQFALRGSRNGALRHYRGSLEVRGVGGQLRLINEVGMDAYLQGVVISEIGDGPLEALKAQAVAARTYAISSRGRWKSDGYDLRDSVDSQAYGGVEAETPDGNRAVQETAGLILTVKGQAIDADFCDDCGGVTAPGDDPDVLPRSVSDEEAHRNIRHSPYGSWTLTLSGERLKALLSKNTRARGHDMLLNIEIMQRDVSNRAQRVRFTWGAATVPAPLVPPPSLPVPPAEDALPAQRGTLPSRHAFRKRPQAASSQLSAQSIPQQTPTPTSAQTLPANAITTEIGGEQLRGLIGYNVLRSTLFTVSRAGSGDFVFAGHGWGHGHGLCQQGALALAATPLCRDCKAILVHYYPGAQLTLWHTAEGEDDAQEKGRRQKAEGRNSGFSSSVLFPPSSFASKVRHGG
jgi:stage II sporulation protein D